MLFLLSPAKALDFESSLGPLPHEPTRPLFAKPAAQLIALLREKSPAQIAALMSLSDNLSKLNVARYRAWSGRFTDKNSRPAVLAFDGDAYGGLQARQLPADALAWLDQHLCILSGLYGVLRPLDRLRPYRLEMGTRLANPQGADLYRFWGDQLTGYVNQRLRADASPVVVNLASQEYFRAIQPKALKARVIDCRFEERQADGSHKVISFFAKRARGLMMRFCTEQRAMTPATLRRFSSEGYALDEAVSSPDRFVFRRGAV